MFFTRHDLKIPFFKHPDGRFLNMSIQEHRDYVVQRDKYLNNAVENGLDLDEVSVYVSVSLDFNCLKCGNSLKDENTIVLDDVERKGLRVPSCICTNCGIGYEFNAEQQKFYLIQT